MSLNQVDSTPVKKFKHPNPKLFRTKGAHLLYFMSKRGQPATVPTLLLEINEGVSAEKYRFTRDIMEVLLGTMEARGFVKQAVDKDGGLLPLWRVTDDTNKHTIPLKDMHNEKGNLLDAQFRRGHPLSRKTKKRLVGDLPPTPVVEGITPEDIPEDLDTSVFFKVPVGSVVRNLRASELIVLRVKVAEQYLLLLKMLGKGA